MLAFERGMRGPWMSIKSSPDLIDLICKRLLNDNSHIVLKQRKLAKDIDDVEYYAEFRHNNKNLSMAHTVTWEGPDVGSSS